MLAVLQRVTQATLHIGGQLHSQIGPGLVVLLGITHTDTPADVTYLARKIADLRIFSDADGKMNLNLTATGGNVLLVSQFTLYANARKGNRPSFTQAAPPDHARPLYEQMITRMGEHLGHPIQTGVFGADMQVSLTNDGPVTILLDTDAA